MNNGLFGFSDNAATPATGAVITASTTLNMPASFTTVAMTSGGQSVTMPNAVGKPLDTTCFFRNTSTSTTFFLRDATGILIASVPPRSEIMVVLTANGTTAGTWAVGNLSEFQFLNTVGVGVTDVLEPVSTNNSVNFVALGGNVFLAAWYNYSTAYPRACLVTVSANVVTSTTPVNIEAAATQSGPVSLALLQSGQAIAYYLSNTCYPRACVLNIANGAITPATPVTVDSTAVCSTLGQCMIALNATQVMVFYFRSTAIQYPACILNIANSVITPAAPLLGTFFQPSGSPYLAVLDSSHVLMCYCNSTYSSTNIMVLGVSGSTISIVGGVNNSTGNLGPSFSNPIAVTVFGIQLVNSSLAFVFCYWPTLSTIYAIPVSISGYVPTAGTASSLSQSGVSGYGVSFISATNGSLYYLQSSELYELPLTLNGTSCTFGNAMTLCPSTGISNSTFYQNTAYQTLLSCEGTSGYPSFLSLEMVK